METCEKVLGRAKANRKEGISQEIWETIEKHKEAKNAMNMARTINQTRDASTRYRELKSKEKL